MGVDERGDLGCVDERGGQLARLVDAELRREEEHGFSIRTGLRWTRDGLVLSSLQRRESRAVLESEAFVWRPTGSTKRTQLRLQLPSCCCSRFAEGQSWRCGFDSAQRRSRTERDRDGDREIEYTGASGASCAVTVETEAFLVYRTRQLDKTTRRRY